VVRESQKVRSIEVLDYLPYFLDLEVNQVRLVFSVLLLLHS
jgi:hypothetical protein